MTAKSFSQIEGLTIKKWAVHRGDGLLLKHTLSDTRLEAMEKFLSKKHKNVVLTPWRIELLWRFWGKYNDVNQINLTFDQHAALVNENANVQNLHSL